MTIPDKVVGQEAVEQRCPLACAVGQDLRHQAAIIVVDDRLRRGAEESERMDVAIDPGLGHCRRTGPNIAAVTVRKIQHEEMRLLLHATDHHHRHAEVRLRMSWRMRQRHEYLLAALIPLAHIILDDRVAAGEPALVSKPVERQT